MSREKPTQQWALTSLWHVPAETWGQAEERDAAAVAHPWILPG